MPRQVKLGVNDLETVRPDLAKQLVDPSLSLSPENWELLTVFEAHWQTAAEKQTS